MRNQSIGLQFTIVVVAAVAATTASVGIASYLSARRVALSEAERRLNLTAIVEASRFRDILSERFESITNWSRLEVMRALVYRDVDKQIADFLERSLSGATGEVAAACIDRSGVVVASAGTPRVIAALDRSPANSFDTLLIEETWFFQFSTPLTVADAPQALQGSLVLAVDPQALLGQRSGGRTDSYTLSLFGEGGTLLAGETAGAAAKDLLTARTPVEVAEFAPQPTVILEVAEPARVALAPIVALQESILLAGVIVLAVASALGAAIAVRVSRPIRLLTAAVEDIRKRGRLWGPIDVPTGPGEIGVLAEAFTRMARTLTLAEERNAAQSRMALLGEVAANIAHEVRTPLTSMRSAGQMLARDDRDAATRQRLASLIVSEADRLDRVVSDLVETARPSAGIRRDCEMSRLVERACATLDPVISEGGYRVDVTAPAHSLTAEVDADQIHQALLNVLRNALDASPHGSPIRVVVRESSADVILEVADHGAGFPASVLERPFAPFQTTKAQGTGLGLAIVRRIVEEHGGQVTLGNIRNGGACVTICLPRTIH